MMAETPDSLLAEVRRRFQAGGIDDPALEARILVGGLLGLTAAGLLSKGGTPVEAEEAARVRAAIERRLSGREPVYRILGFRPFYGLSLALTPETLEPRPDTEILVERMLPHVAAIARRTGRCRILDLGTGTGAICLALLAECPEAMGTGVDLSEGAVAAALRNAARNGLDGRFSAAPGDWFDAITGTFDVIVSNPPYIASRIVDELDPEVRNHDPRLALDGGADGLNAYRRIAEGAGAHLEEGGVIGLEIGFDQLESVTKIFETQGFRLLEHAQDLGGRDRVTIFERA